MLVYQLGHLHDSPRVSSIAHNDTGALITLVVKPMWTEMTITGFELVYYNATTGIYQ
jgi:hypothetical protein